MPDRDIRDAELAVAEQRGREQATQAIRAWAMTICADAHGRHLIDEAIRAVRGAGTSPAPEPAEAGQDHAHTACRAELEQVDFEAGRHGYYEGRADGAQHEHLRVLDILRSLGEEAYPDPSPIDPAWHAGFVEALDTATKLVADPNAGRVTSGGDDCDDDDDDDPPAPTGEPVPGAEFAELDTTEAEMDAQMATGEQVEVVTSLTCSSDSPIEHVGLPVPTDPPGEVRCRGCGQPITGLSSEPGKDPCTVQMTSRPCGCKYVVEAGGAE